MPPLSGKIAVVTGASRGVGRGVALGLGEAGATVYVSGRSVRDHVTDPTVGGTIDDTAEEVTRLGGLGVPVRCDHRDDAQVTALFRRVTEEQGRLDILVNSAWAGYESMVEDGVFTWEQPFWNQPLWRWDAMLDAGVRACYVASQLAVRLMLPRRSGLIVALTHWAGQKYQPNVAYGVAKAATDRLVADMAHELRPHEIAVVSLSGPSPYRAGDAVRPASRYAQLGIATVHRPRRLGLGYGPRDFAKIRTGSGRCSVGQGVWFHGSRWFTTEAIGVRGCMNL